MSISLSLSLPVSLCLFISLSVYLSVIPLVFVAAAGASGVLTAPRPTADGAKGA
jgi:hypothetical protein